MKKRIISVFITALMLSVLPGNVQAAETYEEIVILYENDVHCAVDAYAKLSAMKKELHLLTGDTAEEVAIGCKSLGFPFSQFVFALHVFEELGLVAYGDGRLIVYRGVKADLANSKLYAAVKAAAAKNTESL